jgi:molybdate transport system regulatory protein
VEKHPKIPMTCSVRLRLRGADSFYGIGIQELLKLVQKTNSLQTAAAAMDMSYSKAWKIVRTAEKELGFPLMDRRVGGTGGGSSQLTERGSDFVNRFEQLSLEADEVTNQLFQKHFGDLVE